MRRLAAGLVAGIIVGGSGTALAVSGTQATHDVPRWMNRPCKVEDDVNCYWYGGHIKTKQGEMYVREMPGREHMVCVFFVNRPKRDYCS